MSKAADKQWGKTWSKETKMECSVALQTLASCVYTHWRDRINRECKTSTGEWIEGVGLGNIHDIWNIMYQDMKALYTLEQLVGNQYRTAIIEHETDEADEDAEEGEDD